MHKEILLLIHSVCNQEVRDVMEKALGWPRIAHRFLPKYKGLSPPPVAECKPLNPDILERNERPFMPTGVYFELFVDRGNANLYSSSMYELYARWKRVGSMTWREVLPSELFDNPQRLSYDYLAHHSGMIARGHQFEIHSSLSEFFIIDTHELYELRLTEPRECVRFDCWRGTRLGEWKREAFTTWREAATFLANHAAWAARKASAVGSGTPVLL